MMPVRWAMAPRLVTLAFATLVAACAGTPTGPVSSLPDAVIRNVPAEQAARDYVEPPPLPVPMLETPLDDELPPTPVLYANVIDRIRIGSRLPEVDNGWVRAELNWYASNGDYLERVFARAQRYLYFIANEVEARGLPMELALLPVVESAFNPFAYSRSQAAGLWQFIPGTGKRYQLSQDWWRDERRDVLASTRAALDYLAYLNELFDGDWMLAVAAYNYGAGNIARAIRRNKSLGRRTDFFSLSLPRETRTYVPKLLAITRLLHNPQAYGLTLPMVPDAPYFEVVYTGGPVDLRLAAELAGVDVEEIHALNPGWNQWVTAPAGPHRLLVPAVVAAEFNRRFAALEPAERAGLAPRTIEAGDTLNALASRYRVPVSFLQVVNGTDGSGLSVGDAVYVPDRDVSPLRPGLVKAPTSVHVVRSGDSLWTISRRYGMSVGELARANDLSTRSILRPGQRLAVRPRGTDGTETLRLASAGDPAPAAAGTAEATPAAAPGETRRIAYRVRRGDTLSGIARRFSVSVGDLQAWNDLQGTTSIRAGQRLTIHVDGERDYGG
jgi:membrane-bound lytic murein transglycosylase D